MPPPASSSRTAARPPTWPLAATFPLTPGLHLPARVRGTCPAATGQILLQTPPTHPRTVALTFDDGPGPWTSAVLAVLARHRVHGTFFEVGTNVALAPGGTRAVVAGGNLVGSHTWDHRTEPSAPRGLDGMTTAGIGAEIGMGTAELEAVGGQRICFFRAAQGTQKTLAVRSAAAGHGEAVTGWAATAKDFAQTPRPDLGWERRIVSALTGKGDHPILLMHDGNRHGYRGNTVAALDQIIAWYASRGYVFTDPAGRRFPTAPQG